MVGNVRQFRECWPLSALAGTLLSVDPRALQQNYLSGRQERSRVSSKKRRWDHLSLSFCVYPTFFIASSRRLIVWGEQAISCRSWHDISASPSCSPCHVSYPS
ncbi:hypothetical protein EV356DRAFT_201945 [Viridothelium virens]|uniref:Uncharacterized protein n=1 Tax=Viridothelium virens TaxID=1048519 RepID=A0A6A6H621_VIRVR|nr:hypothetical protein EV356DRAFT_201945 [Viridothelium virens]